MLEKPLLSLTLEDIKEAYNKNGFHFFEEGFFNLNFFGIREKSNKAGTWDDVLGVAYVHPTKGWKVFLYQASVDAGLFYLKNPINKAGTAFIVEGQYSGLYKRGLHNGKFEALRQSRSVKVYRDGNRNDQIDLFPETIQEGMFNVNVHCSFERNANLKSSAGCQILKARYSDPEYWQFLWHFDESIKIWGNSFTYTLFNREML